MSSATVDAQRLANEANIQNTQETNKTNFDISNATNALNKQIAEEQNALNYQMFNEQNNWNLAQWERENAYNSPKQQVQRYMEAGINPLWAMSKGDSGNAQHLTSAGSAPAAGASMVAPNAIAPQVAPEYDANKIGNIISAATNVSNTLQGFYKLGLESFDTDTRRNVANSQIGVNSAEALFKKSQTIGQDIFNNLNTDTYGVLVGTKQREYDKLVSDIDNAKKQGQLTDALIDNAKETKNQIIAMTNFTSRQADAILEQTRQGWYRLAIDKQNANTNAQNADTSYFAAHSDSYYKGEELKLKDREFRFQREKFYEDIKGKSTDQLLEMCRLDQTWLNKFLPYSFTSAVGAYFSDGKTNLDQVFERFDRLQYIGHILESKQFENPSESNLKSYQEYLDILHRLPVAPSSVPSPSSFNTSNTSVINPSSDWNH